MQYTLAMQRQKPLLETTYKLLRKSGLSYQQLADGTGLGKDWVAKFSQEAIREPGVSKVQKLHDFLVARKAASPAPTLESAA